ncbi:hypothetical protein YC2023_045365 [Brassica napus]
MANNPKHPLEDPPSSPSSSASKKEIESEEEEGQHLHTIFSSEEDEPPRSGFKEDVCGSSESQLTGRKRLTTNSAISNFKVKIGTLKKKYTRSEMRGGEASLSNPHEQKCFQLSNAIWGADGVAFECSISYNSQSKDSERRGLTKKRDLVTPRKGKRGDTKKAPLVEKESTGWDDESSFFLGMDFLKEKWTKVPTTGTKKETQEKMRKWHANELECQKFEDMLKVMRDKCARDKVELLNEVTSLIMAAD